MTELLSLIAGRETTGYVEVRWATDNGMGQKFFPVGSLAAAGEHIGNLAARTDVFIGAAPRVRRAGGRDAVQRAWCLWVDIDSTDWQQKLSLSPVAPSLIIASGSGGVHAYFSLTKPAPAKMIEQGNRRLAHLLGADPKCVDAARIMRPPQTWNHKHNPARPVTRVGGTQRLVSMLIVADLVDPVSGSRKRNVVPHRHEHADRLLGISAREYVPALSGREVNSGGKAQCPFHGGGHERTPSLHAYTNPAKGWRCYGCEKGGTVYDFAGELWGLSTRGDGFREIRHRLKGVLL